jgi:hypothetical protein
MEYLSTITVFDASWEAGNSRKEAALLCDFWYTDVELLIKFAYPI